MFKRLHRYIFLKRLDRKQKKIGNKIADEYSKDFKKKSQEILADFYKGV